jgi:hypothetical protein
MMHRADALSPDKEPANAGFFIARVSVSLSPMRGEGRGEEAFAFQCAPLPVALAGRPAGGPYFLLLRQKKVGKENATPCGEPLKQSGFLF